MYTTREERPNLVIEASASMAQGPITFSDADAEADVDVEADVDADAVALPGANAYADAV